MTNVDYGYLVSYTEVDRGRLDELVGLILDTVCPTKPTNRVAGEKLPAEVVRSRLLKLTGAHLLYVLGRINENTTTGSSISTGRTWNIESSHDAEKPCNAAPCPLLLPCVFRPDML